MDGILSAINPLPSRVIGPQGGDCDGWLLRKGDAVSFGKKSRFGVTCCVYILP